MQFLIYVCLLGKCMLCLEATFLCWAKDLANKLPEKVQRSSGL